MSNSVQFDIYLPDFLQAVKYVKKTYADRTEILNKAFEITKASYPRMKDYDKRFLFLRAGL